MNRLRIAGAALNQTPFDWENNLNNILHAIEWGQKENVDILCLPELCITGYGSEDQFLGDWLWKKALSLVPSIVEKTKGILITLGLPLRVEGKIYNCNCLIYDGKILGIVAKQFLANEGVHYEPRWFIPWPANKTIDFEINGEKVPFGDVVVNHKGITIGMEICEDAWVGENRPASRLAQRGVDLIVNPSASHFAFNKSKIRENLAIEASKAHNLVYLYANLLGNESGRMLFDGEIFISGQGNIYKYNNRFSYENVNLIFQDIDFDDIDSTPTLNIDPEDKNEIFTKALCLGLFDYLRKSRSNGFVLSLSGGADSSTCAVLVNEMVRRGVNEIGLEHFLQKIGKSKLFKNTNHLPLNEQIKQIVYNLLACAYQGTINSSEDTFQSAKELAEECGAVFHHWRIDEEVNSYRQKIEKAIDRELTWERDDITLQNIQARARSPIIWMLANINNALLLTTSNRSEGDVGYATMDGDTSGSIAPIAAVDKYFIINWLKWAKKNLDFKSLHFVNSLQPTAELRPQEKSQTDETDLMPYHVLVQIERLAVKDHKNPLEVYDELKGEINKENLKRYITKFYQLWSKNQWKRERIAPSFHLDDFNVDPKTWCRFPILSGGFAEELETLSKLK